MIFAVFDVSLIACR